MNFLRLIKRLFSEPKKGLLGYLNLSRWYYDLPASEQNKIREYSGADSYGLTKSNLQYTSQSIESFFSLIAENALRAKDFDFAIKYLDKVNPDTWDVSGSHFFYQTLAEEFYRLRDSYKKAIVYSIDYCQKDIRLIEEDGEDLLDYFASLQSGYRGYPVIGTFKRLSIIFEKQNKIEEAIRTCEKAIELGILMDGTKRGYPGRLEKLKKKR